MYSWIQSYSFQRSARVTLDGQTRSSVKIRGVPQGGVISPTLFIIFIDDIYDQLSSHIPRALHANDLALWTKAEQVTIAAIRMQEAMNLISDWEKEWLVMINRTKTEATCFPCLPREKSSSCRSMEKKSTSKKTSNVPRSEARQKTYQVSPHQHHVQQSSRENGPDEKKAVRNKMGSQHENLDLGLHLNCQTPHRVCLQCRSSAARTKQDQLTKAQNSGLRITTGSMKTIPRWKGRETCCHWRKGERKNSCTKVKR